jgi:uncharacterized protein YecT (DUF1311 family)
MVKSRQFGLNFPLPTHSRQLIDGIIMTRIAPILLVLLTGISQAAENSRAIEETARQTGRSVDYVRKHHRSGCDSGNIELMNLCGKYHFIAQDIKLNELYKAVKKNIQSDKDALVKLISSQRAWIKFRDATCEYESDGFVGSRMQSGVKSSCIENLTKERITHLERYKKCTRPTCPGNW